jgi:primary-amine oxidase
MRTKAWIALPAAMMIVVAAGATTARAADEPWPYCGGSSVIQKDLPNGTRWQMCWRIDAKSGLVLDKIAVKGSRDGKLIMVMDSITLAQLNVPYDTGETEYNDLTSFGLGADALQPLTGGNCNGTMRGERTATGEDAKKVLCLSVEERGLAYHSADNGVNGAPRVKQGQDLVLRVISKVGWYEYVTEYRFADTGEITSRLGATGDLSPNDFGDAKHGWPIGAGAARLAANHYHSAFWRVHFDIGGNGKNVVEQLDTRKTGTGALSAIFDTTRKTIDREASLTTALRRKWRVVSSTSLNGDGHARSYELVFGANDAYEGHKETVPDVTFTQFKACEKFATFNLDPQCPGRSVLQYVNNETMTDPVMWVRVGFHHIPRDEDESPMPMHWQGFELVPRDFTADNPIAPPAR